jgi:GNAT superfamily N-acetyltransferase
MNSKVIEGIFEQHIEIKKVQSRRRLKDFIFLPWKIYKSSPKWSPTLITKEFRRLSKKTNPFFQHSDAAFFIAYSQNKPVGRIAAIINNRHEAFHHDGAGFFGFFECCEDYYVAKRLLMAAEIWCKERGKRSLLGPVNLSIHEEYGLLIEGYQKEPYIFMPYNPHYYQTFIEKHGYKKHKDMYAYQIPVKNSKPQLNKQEPALPLHANTPELNFRDLKGAVARPTLINIFKEVFNTEWHQQYGVLPLTDKEVDFILHEYTKWILPELVLIGEIKGQPISCMIMLPNFNEISHRLNGPFSFLNNILLPFYKHRIHTARCVLFIVRRHVRSQGIHIKMFQEAIRRLDKLGFHTLELSWVSEDHIATRHVIEGFGLNPTKKYRLFKKDIPKEHLYSYQPNQQLREL